MTKRKYWTEEEEALLIQLKDDLNYTYEQISIEIGRSANSCKVKYYKLINPQYLENQRQNTERWDDKNRKRKNKRMREYRKLHPEKVIGKERYSGELEDKIMCYEFYNGVSPITGAKDKLQVHHLISVKDNIKFWESAAPEIKIKYLVLIPKDLHMSYHSWMGGTHISGTPDSFWFFINNVWCNNQVTLDSFVL